MVYAIERKTSCLQIAFFHLSGAIGFFLLACCALLWRCIGRHSRIMVTRKRSCQGNPVALMELRAGPFRCTCRTSANSTPGSRFLDQYHPIPGSTDVVQLACGPELSCSNLGTERTFWATDYAAGLQHELRHALRIDKDGCFVCERSNSCSQCRVLPKCRTCWAFLHCRGSPEVFARSNAQCQ